MKRQITVEIPDKEDCNTCEFETYDGDNCWCNLFHQILHANELCDECVALRNLPTLSNIGE